MLYLFGLPRSGTTFLESLLHKNLESSLDSVPTNFDKLWKHSFNWRGSITSEDQLIVIYKNIFTWLESVLIRRPEYGFLILDTLRKQLPEVHSQYTSIESDYWFCDNRVSLEAIVLSYQYFYTNYINYSKEGHQDGILIRYEDLLYDDGYHNLVEYLVKILDVEEVNYEYRVGKVHQSSFFNEASRLYYLNTKPFFFPEELIFKIDSILDDHFLSDLEELKLKIR